MYSVNSPNSRPSASTASAETALSGEYEVFLSFCGKDTRYGFTDFLYTDLRSASIRTFRDDNELHVGEEIGPELSKAIENSKISIPIFSKNYASSKWCLLELAHIVKCHAEAKGEKMIFPIFYDVEPYDVRHQSGSYKKAFRQHEKKKRLEVQTVQIWREALTKVGQLKGLELKKETSGREGKLVKLAVEKCLQFLKKHYPHVPLILVGMDNHIRNLKGLLEVDSDKVRIVGIYGMGGLGKTTMAKIIYNQLTEHFEGHCFLENVRENSSPRDRIVNLQNQLISKIQNREVPKFNDFYEGSKRIKEAVRGRKLLIVLDDVDEKFHVDMLMGSESWFGIRSRIIITTRNKSVLDEIERACQRKDMLYVYASYQPDFMDDLHSLQLFSKYAFKRDSPIEEYFDLSQEVVYFAAGLPLVLVVLGSTFSGVEGKDLWEENVRKLREIPNDEVLDKLRFSFEALKYEQKQIFLDIVCLFIGLDVTRPTYMWDDCKFYPREGITVLINKSLITISDDNKFIMHDQLRDLGRQIVREESLNELGKRSRLWYKEDALDVLETSQGTSSVNALCLRSIQSEGPVLASSFHDLSNLRYLNMGYLDLDGEFKRPLSNLRWLGWNCSGKFIPTNLYMKNLVILDLSWSKFTEDWDGWNHIKVGKKLKVLDLSYSSGLRVLPHLSMHPSLEILKLDRCSLVCRLDGIEELKTLKYLHAWGCEQLQSLPSLSNLTNLVELNLSGCEQLIEIHGLEKLERLQVLKIKTCISLKRLPDVSNLKELKTFIASACVKLIEIEGLHKLNSLEHLDLRDCNCLKGVIDMSNLDKLNVLRAPTLEVTNISNLKMLKELHASFSDKLIEFQGLDGLESLAVCVSSVKRLPDLSLLKRLKGLLIEYCHELDEIEVLGALESLQDLFISACRSVERVQFLSNLRKLKYFECCSCKKIIEIQGLDKLKSLESFKISSCPSLERLPDLPNFGMLKDIKVMCCNKLNEVEGIGVIESLESLEISDCNKLRDIPNLRRLKYLKRLKIWSLKELTEINGLEELKSLECLFVYDCVKLAEIQGLEGLRCLSFLHFSECESIEALPDISNLENLRILDVSGCLKLTKILGIEELNSLEELNVVRCEGLINLPDLPNVRIRRNF